MGSTLPFSVFTFTARVNMPRQAAPTDICEFVCELYVQLYAPAFMRVFS